MPTAKTNRLLVPGAAGAAVIVLLLLYCCGPGSQDSLPIAEESVPLSEPIPVVTEVIVEEIPVASVADDSPEPVVEAAPPPAPEPEVVAVVAVPAVEAKPPAAPAVPRAPVAAPPPVVEAKAPEAARVPTTPEPLPEQDLLIADAAHRRFKPNVAADALASLSVGTPIQGDENSLSVLQPCDTAASGCAAGLQPGQVVGTPNDWTGVLLPGF